MDSLSKSDVLVKVIGDFFNGKLDASSVASLAKSAQVEQYFEDGNLVFLALQFDHEGEHYALDSTNLIWDQEKAAWFSFFDGSAAGSDSYFEPDGSGGHRIVWM